MGWRVQWSGVYNAKPVADPHPACFPATSARISIHGCRLTWASTTAQAAPHVTHSNCSSRTLAVYSALQFDQPTNRHPFNCRLTWDSTTGQAAPASCTCRPPACSTVPGWTGGPRSHSRCGFVLVGRPVVLWGLVSSRQQGVVIAVHIRSCTTGLVPKLCASKLCGMHLPSHLSAARPATPSHPRSGARGQLWPSAVLLIYLIAHLTSRSNTY